MLAEADVAKYGFLSASRSEFMGINKSAVANHILNHIFESMVPELLQKQKDFVANTLKQFVEIYEPLSDDIETVRERINQREINQVIIKQRRYLEMTMQMKINLGVLELNPDEQQAFFLRPDYEDIVAKYKEREQRETGYDEIQKDTDGIYERFVDNLA